MFPRCSHGLVIPKLLCLQGDMLQDVPKIIFSQWSIFPGSYSSQGPMPSASSVPKMLLGCCVPSMSLRAYSMFPESYVSQYPVSGSHVPSGLCSQGAYVFWGDLWFPRPYVPMGLRSQGLRVHTVYVPKVLCSQGPRFQGLFTCQAPRN